ncbi:hypothetical protein [Paraburkholderia aromaticivorans]|uniref:hypothetical protein n=1 Tax=Paraburkholderia aromaticivorans TaxID=2026199 RepID=UPI0014561000|nr:hypothetical protein [Paraburkholderia aromaticivorans]
MKKPTNTGAADLRALGRTTQKSARLLLQEKFNSIVERRRASGANLAAATEAANVALRRVLAQDKEFAAAIKPLVTASRTGLLKIERTEPRLGRPLSRESALGLLSGSGIRGLGGTSGSIVMTMAKDTRIDVRGVPYNDAWTNAGGGAHQQQTVWADKNTGQFGFLYTIGKEGGALTCGAGVEVLFMRDVPGFPPGQGPAGLAQVRAYTPYNYVWHDKSYLGTAHQHAGFGVLVWSAPIDGGPSRTDLDHEYWVWSDGTSWYEEHNNASFPGQDWELALQYGNEAPYFSIEPGRLYGAWIWCFAQSDAHGADLTSAAYAQALIDATATFIVIGQQ